MGIIKVRSVSVTQVTRGPYGSRVSVISGDLPPVSIVKPMGV